MSTLEIELLERQLAELQAQRKIATDDPGISARPNGEEFYRWALKASTTTTMTRQGAATPTSSTIMRIIQSFTTPAIGTG